MKNDQLYSAARKFAHHFYRDIEDFHLRQSATREFKRICREEYGFEYHGRQEFDVVDPNKMLLFTLKWS